MTCSARHPCPTCAAVSVARLPTFGRDLMRGEQTPELFMPTLDEHGRPADNVCPYDGQPCGGDCPPFNPCTAPAAPATDCEDDETSEGDNDDTGAVCYVCDAPATCRGRYEGHGPVQFGCDTHCGHGCEDGWCERVGGTVDGGDCTGPGDGGPDV